MTILYSFSHRKGYNTLLQKINVLLIVIKTVLLKLNDQGSRYPKGCLEGIIFSIETCGTSFAEL